LIERARGSNNHALFESVEWLFSRSSRGTNARLGREGDRMRTQIVMISAALSVAMPLSAHGQARRRPPAAAAATAAAGNARPQETLSMREAVEALHSNDPDRVIQGVLALTVISSPAVIPPLVELLHSGPPDRVTDEVVAKLGIIGQPAAIEELSNLLHHRRPAVREAAIHSLSQIHDDRVRPLIESGLHDSDHGVRGQAAEALGDIGARQSVGLLFRAFERGVPEAAESIGRLGEASVAVSTNAAWDRDDPRATAHPHTLAMWLGRMPLSVLLRGFERFLNRNDVPVAVKEQIVVRLEQQASAQVRDFLQRWVQSLPAAYHGRDRARAELAVQQIRVPTGGAQ
jgi:HEAT repeat protein